MPSRKIVLPYLALGVGILSLSFSAIFVRWANAPGTVMGFYRMGLATAALFPVFLINAHKRKLILRKEMLVFPYWRA